MTIWSILTPMINQYGDDEGVIFVTHLQPVRFDDNGVIFHHANDNQYGDDEGVIFVATDNHYGDDDGVIFETTYNQCGDDKVVHF